MRLNILLKRKNNEIKYFMVRIRTRVRVRNRTPQPNHPCARVGSIRLTLDGLSRSGSIYPPHRDRTPAEHLIVERAGSIGAFAALINIDHRLFFSPLSPDYFLGEWGEKRDLGFQARAARGMRKEKEEEEEKKKPQAPVNPPLLET